MQMKLQEVDCQPNDFRAYREIIDPELYEQVVSLAGRLRGAKIIILSATAYGGGVAEILKSQVPLMRSLGLDAHWLVLPPDPDLFAVTKNFHDALQGKDYAPTDHEKHLYLERNDEAGKLLAQLPADIYEIHDPQPAAVIAHLPAERSVWRCHIDTSSPSRMVWDFLWPYVARFSELVFTLPEYVPRGVEHESINYIAPTIDPLSDKNRPMEAAMAAEKVHQLGLDTKQPLITQVSRYDVWKDPRGVVEAYRIAKLKAAGLQLALVGSMASDDPSAQAVYEDLQVYCAEDPDIHLLVDLSEDEVNALRTQADIILQKSIREGFGLTVAEGMWKSKPVIGGNVGGIKLQITDGQNGYLVNSVTECAKRILELLADPANGSRLGEQGHATVREQFLHPRLIRDHMLIYARRLGLTG